MANATDSQHQYLATFHHFGYVIKIKYKLSVSYGGSFVFTYEAQCCVAQGLPTTA